MKTDPARLPLIGAAQHRVGPAPKMLVKTCKSAKCQKQFVTDSSRRLYCTEKCRQRNKDDQAARRAADNERHRRRYREDPAAHNARNGRAKTRAEFHGVLYEEIDPVEIFERDKWTCGICHRRVSKSHAYPDLRSASLDHVIPWAAGGEHTPENVQCSHLRCNLEKGKRLMEELKQSV